MVILSYVNSIHSHFVHQTDTCNEGLQGMLAPAKNAAQNVVKCWSDTMCPEATDCSSIQFITTTTPAQKNKTKEKLHRKT